MSRSRDLRLTTPDTRSRLNTAAQQIISNTTTSLRHEAENGLEGRMEELDKKNSTIAALQRNFEGLSNMCKEERLKANEWKRQYDDSMKSIDGFKRRIADLESKLRISSESFEKLTLEKQSLLKINEENGKLKSEFAVLKANLQKKTQETIEKERAVDRLRLELDRSNQNCGVLQSEISRLKSLFSDMSSNVTRLQTDLDTANSYIEQNSEELKSVKNELKSTKETAAELEAMNAEMSRFIEDMKRGLGQAEEERKDGFLRAEKLANELFGLRLELQEANERAENVENSEKAIKRQLELEMNEKGLGFNTISALQKEAKSLRNRISELEGEKNSLEIDASELRLLVEKSEKLRKKEGEMWEMQAKMRIKTSEEQERRIEELEKDAKTSMEDMEKLKLEAKMELETAENRFKFDQSFLESAFKAKESELTLQLTTEISQNSDLSLAKKEKEREIQTLRETLERKLKESQELEGKVTMLLGQISQLRKCVEQLELANSDMTQIKKLMDEISSQRSELDSLRQKLALSQSELERFQHISKAEESLRSQVLQLETALAAAQKDGSHYKQIYEYINEKYEAGMTELASAKAGLTAISVDFAQLRKVNKALEEKANLSGQASTEVREELQTLQRQLDSDRANLISLRSQNSELTERMTSLQSQLETAQSSRSGGGKTELLKAVEDISHAVFAMESNLACNSCLEILNDPIVCVPCGHNYCRACTDGYDPSCQQCGRSAAVKYTMKNGVVNDVASKLVFAKQVLEGVKAVLK